MFRCIGVGLLYQQGYFRQHIDADGQSGWRSTLITNRAVADLSAARANGEWLRISIHLPGVLPAPAHLGGAGRARAALSARFERSGEPSRIPRYHSELYGGGPELRLQQERILGIGGWRLLRALGIRPEVCHLNEGHAAFAVLERARSFMEETKQPFDVAFAATRAGNLFTHIRPWRPGLTFLAGADGDGCRDYAEERLGIPFSQMMALGRLNPEDDAEPFNMAYLAIRGSGAVNGVSRLHGEVSRRIFQPLFPRWPQG